MVEDKFDSIYQRQEEFENLLISKNNLAKTKLLKDFNKQEKTKMSKELAFLLFLEIAEFMDAVGNFRSHKTQEDGKDEKEIKEEIADMFIFVISIALTHNMSAADLLEEVKNKQKTNFDRQKSDY